MPGSRNRVEQEKVNVAGWGNYPVMDSSLFSFDTESEAIACVGELDEMIPRGNGRSYGDSSINTQVLSILKFNRFISFDEQNGILHCESGVMLSDIVRIFLPMGWFPAIVPGTRLITIGGAIASDIHGKNHHHTGCFSSCVVDFRLLLSDGTVISCSEDKNSEVFRATCGGMGLTGIILDVRMKLKRFSSRNILQKTVKTSNLQATFDVFEKYAHLPYSVAWIDCLAPGRKLGRCIFTAGEHADDRELNYTPSPTMNVPVYLPSFVLNNLTVKAFNFLYYNRLRQSYKESIVLYDDFFFPLDAVHNWNRIYGKPGFTQYQFVLPKAESFNGLEEILTKIYQSGKGSFLAVLKLFGKGNENYLSFPMEGYTLTLDFRITSGIFRLLDELDKIVMKYHGRIYLTKDARVSPDVFAKGYVHLDHFLKVRKELGCNRKFVSLQSKRLNL